MPQLVCYHTEPPWDHKYVSSFFDKEIIPVSKGWFKLQLIKGHLVLRNKDGVEIGLDDNLRTPLLDPQHCYRVISASTDVSCICAHYCLPEEYTHRKYGMTQTHSEVIAAASGIMPGKVLDLGCGSGRNALYLQKLSWHVTALDQSIVSIDRLKTIKQSDALDSFEPNVYDINEACLTGEYDWVISTVVMMFLSRDRIPDIIKNMQSVTKVGGYNLVVSAMSTDDCPCQLPFSFTFQSDELKSYYRDWEILKYNENLGELHRTDAQGNRIKLRFATLLAKKRA